MNARNLYIVATCLISVGCATPQPVLDLADKTSANVGIVSARLRQVSAESNRLYANRADRVARLQGENAKFRARLAYDKALTAKAGEAGDLELINELQGWVKQVDQIFAEAEGAEKQQREALLARQATIDTKSPTLQKVAETLSVLAKEQSTADRVKFLTKFVREVRDDAKKNLDDGSTSAANAKELLDHIRGQSMPSTATQ